MKKVLSLVLVLSMVLGSFSFAFAAPTDVVGTEYEDAVERLGQLKVLEGYPDGTFKPGNEITRAEFAAVVIRAKGLAAAADAAKGATGFTDVPATNWAAGYINIASKMGFVKGMGDGTFAPNSPVTYEQAVTMVMRALGYEPAAEARGGYPYGYLIVANETGLLEKVNGTQGAPALRGLVAQIVDNALEIPLMVQVSYGDRVEHIVSGTRDGVKEQTLLSELNFTKFTGRVIEVNADKEFVKVENSEGTVKVLYANEDFDFQNALGLTLRVWYDTYANVKLYTALDTPMFDAVEHYKGGLYLYGEDAVYDLATDTKDKVIATLILDGKEVNVDKFNADYAKVVLDSYGDVIWAEGFTLEGNIVVEKLDGNVVESYGYEELSLKGYTLVDREGKSISVEDLEKNDIVFYNSKVKFAVAYNESVTGTIEKVYQNPDSFILDGEKYEVGYTKYLDGEVLGNLDYNIVNSIKTEDEEVTAYFDFYGNLVLLEGTRAASAPASVALVIDSVEYSSRGTKYYTLDVLNSEGKIVNYDLSQKEVLDILKANKMTQNLATWSSLVGVSNVEDTSASRTASDKIVNLTVNASGKVTGVSAIAGTETIVDSSSTWLSTTATYVNNKAKLQGNAVVFRVDGETEHKYYSVTTWDKADEEFTRVESGKAYYNSMNNVVAIYALETNAQAATTSYTGLVTDVRVLRGNLKADVTMEIKGEEKVITVPTSIATYNKLVEDAIVKVTVVNKTGEISVVDNITTVTGKVVSTTPGSRIIKVGSTNYYLENDAVIYQDGSFATLRFADLKVNDIVELYPIATGSQYVNYVVKDVVEDDKPATGTITYISGTAVNVTLPADAVVSEYAVVIGENARGIVDGKADFAGVLENGKIYTAKLVKTAELDKAIDTVTFVANITAPVVEPVTLEDVRITSLSDNTIRVDGNSTLFRFNAETEYDIDGTVTIDDQATSLVTIGDYVTLVVEGNQVVSLTYDTTVDTDLKAAAVLEEAILALEDAIADAETLLADEKAVVAGVSEDDQTALSTAFTTYEGLVADNAAFATAIQTAKDFDVTGKTATAIDAITDALVTYDGTTGDVNGGAMKTFLDAKGTFDNAVTALETARTDLTNAIADANTLANEEQVRLDSFTASEIAAINSNHTDGYDVYASALVAFKGAIQTAEDFDVTGESASAIDAITDALVTYDGNGDVDGGAMDTFLTAKGTFDGLATVDTIGK